MVEALLAVLEEQQPALVAISGDLTQRARHRQFAAARAFLEQIRAPVLVVPGNHDVPLWNVYARFLNPLTRYKRYVSADLTPRFETAGLVALGINTARSATWKNGRVSHGQMRLIREVFGNASAEQLKVLVTHHPFMPPPDDPTQALVGRGYGALQVAEGAGVDLLLAGHLHVGYTGDIRSHHLGLRRSMLVVHAGTAISRRLREDANAFNLITVEPPRIRVAVQGWSLSQFVERRASVFARDGDGWRLES